jgi:hypothetical protein
MTYAHEKSRAFLERWARQRLGAATEVLRGTSNETDPAAPDHFIVRYSWSRKDLIFSTAFRVPLAAAEQACREQRTDIFDSLFEASRRVSPKS